MSYTPITFDTSPQTIGGFEAGRCDVLTSDQSQLYSLRTKLVGKTGDFGQMLGLSNVWAANVIRQVGNYGEVFERNVGKDTPLAISRGLNDLWTRGGLQYGPPIR